MYLLLSTAYFLKAHLSVQILYSKIYFYSGYKLTAWSIILHCYIQVSSSGELVHLQITTKKKYLLFAVNCRVFPSKNRVYRFYIKDKSTYIQGKIPFIIKYPIIRSTGTQSCVITQSLL